MSFKKRMMVVTITCVFTAIALSLSLVAIFANNNLLVKTNVSVSYTAPDLSEAYVSANSWRCDESTKTQVLATTNATEVSGTPGISKSLTERNTYMFIEFVVENRSSTDKYYLEERFKSSSVRNISFDYIAVAEQLDMGEILSQDLSTVKEYFFNGTRVASNVTLNPGDKLYLYAVVGVNDLAKNATFSGNFVINLSLDPFDDREQTINIYDKVFSDYYYGSSVYYIKMGEMPQSYAGTDDSLYTLTEDDYTECGVNYDIYVDEDNNRYAKKNGAYYKFEPIAWHVIGVYGVGYQTIYTYLNSFEIRNVNASNAKRLVVTPMKILFNSAWNSDLVRVNYPNSTIYQYLNEFYENVLSEYSEYIKELSGLVYNDMENSVITTIKDYGSGTGFGGNTTQRLWLLTTTESSSYKIGKAIYNTAWAEGVETPGLGKWWTRTNQYNNTDGEIFVANAIGVDEKVVATNINEVCGVRPAMVVDIPY